MNMITIVMGYRNRDLARVQRCLDSLRAQTFHDFSVIFVDYGSDMDRAQAAHTLTGAYDFAKYIYSDTRGQPWNRAHALNIGIRAANTDYVITTDIDMIFSPGFMAITAAHAAPDRVIYCPPRFLPKDFADWNHLEHYIDTLPIGDRRQLGGFQCALTRVLHDLHGFDEFYRYWGVEDRDLATRLEKKGITHYWLHDHAPDASYLFHQWHPPSNHLNYDFMPLGVWDSVILHNLQHEDILLRNPQQWGSIATTEERTVLQFLDLETSQLIAHDSLHIFSDVPTSNQSLNRVVRVFRELEAGHALAIDHAFYPEKNIWGDRILRYGNRLLQLLSVQNTLIAYDVNRLHNFLARFIQEYGETMIADYYLNFPARKGTTILVRA